jgi:putative transposase
MPRNARCVESGLPYHVTQRGVDRKDVFFSRTDRLTYLRLAQANLKESQIRVYAWCLMTNHVHWVVSPGHPDSLAIFFRRLHGRYAQYLNPRRGRTGHLWQNRFFSCPVGPTHLWRTLRYVEANPVRAGLSLRSDNYRWSSAAAHLATHSAEAAGLIDHDFWRDVGGAAGWRDNIGDAEDYSDIRDLRACTFSGKPYGTDAFLQQLEERFQRHWRPVGRPPTAHTADT